jgi:hypothetical protein
MIFQWNPEQLRAFATPTVKEQYGTLSNKEYYNLFEAPRVEAG